MFFFSDLNNQLVPRVSPLASLPSPGNKVAWQYFFLNLKLIRCFKQSAGARFFVSILLYLSVLFGRTVLHISGCLPVPELLDNRARSRMDFFHQNLPQELLKKFDFVLLNEPSNQRLPLEVECSKLKGRRWIKSLTFKLSSFSCSVWNCF